MRGENMEEVKLIRNEMKDRVQKLITQKDTSDGKANLAKLRHGIGKKPGEMPELWDVFFNKMSPELFSKSNEPSRSEWAIYISLTMFALHQQGSSETVHCEGRSLGSAAADLMEEKTDENRERIMRRFGPVVTAKDMPELSHHIRGLVQLFKAKSVKLDYIRLAEDLYWFQDTNKRKNVQLKWGEDFYREKGEDLS
ncbi:MAG TPA: type I-E CRISPR-associated protein Cse2/CasB [Ruminococcus sp.]|nr:type I-E CRISPR-associated protein Cse2/CasB [Ruminococcus sp.]HCY66637.1 type I-E CRISPR-associated protein Cse2/CasB [Ruminococcus sp.]